MVKGPGKRQRTNSICPGIGIKDGTLSYLHRSLRTGDRGANYPTTYDFLLNGTNCKFSSLTGKSAFPAYYSKQVSAVIKA